MTETNNTITTTVATTKKAWSDARRAAFEAKKKINVVAKSEVEDHPAVYNDGDDGDDKSTISTIADENEKEDDDEEEEEECCECCGKFDADGIGNSTGFNGVKMRVCDNCDTDGSDYNGWGGEFEDEKEEEAVCGDCDKVLVDEHYNEFRGALVCDDCYAHKDYDDVRVNDEAEAEVVEDPAPAEMLLPTLEDDPVVLRTLVTTLQAEVVRLTAFNQDLQRRMQGVRKQPKAKAEKAEKANKESKRKVNRPKRPDDYAQQYIPAGRVLKWTHGTRNAWAEATYIGAGKFRARYSFNDEVDEGLSLHAVGAVMSKHLSIRGVNAWSTFKNLDGTSVANLDLQAA